VRIIQIQLLHFNMFPVTPPGFSSYLSYLEQIPLLGSVASVVQQRVKEFGLSASEIAAVRRRAEFFANGRGYMVLNSTRPATIGYAIGASPLSLLAYIGEKIQAWSDPSALDMDDLLATVVIYYLSDSFHTSVMIYNQSAKVILSLYNGEGVWGGRNIKSTIGYSAFPYEIGPSPRSWIAKYANIVEYKTHAVGGHFPAFDNPDALVGDMRNLVTAHWWKITAAQNGN